MVDLLMPLYSMRMLDEDGLLVSNLCNGVFICMAVSGPETFGFSTFGFELHHVLDVMAATSTDSSVGVAILRKPFFGGCVGWDCKVDS
jgi:hypothetical protein